MPWTGQIPPGQPIMHPPCHPPIPPPTLAIARSQDLAVQGLAWRMATNTATTAEEERLQCLVGKAVFDRCGATRTLVFDRRSAVTLSDLPGLLNGLGLGLARPLHGRASGPSPALAWPGLWPGPALAWVGPGPGLALA
jgi:hypothetical protein